MRLGRKAHAFIVSIGISIMYIFAFKLVPGAGLIELASYTLGGALGIVGSIYFHEWYVKYHNINDNRGVSPVEPKDS